MRAVFPSNYRELPLFLIAGIKGYPSLVGGMAHPYQPDPTMRWLEQRGMRHVISLHEFSNHSRNARQAGLGYTHHPIKDFSFIPASTHEKIFEQVRLHMIQQRLVTIHCDAGDGRTGTILAGLKLRERFQHQFVSQPDALRQPIVRTKSRGEYYGVSCSTLVTQVIDEVRTAGYENTHNGTSSIENKKDIKSINEYETALRKKFSRYLDLLDQDRSGALAFEKAFEDKDDEMVSLLYARGYRSSSTALQSHIRFHEFIEQHPQIDDQGLYQHAINTNDRNLLKVLFSCQRLITREALMTAITSDSCEPETLKLIIKQTPSSILNEMDTEGRTPLIIAVQSRRHNAVRYLMRHRMVDKKHRDNNGRTAYSYALEQSATDQTAVHIIRGLTLKNRVIIDIRNTLTTYKQERISVLGDRRASANDPRDQAIAALITLLNHFDQPNVTHEYILAIEEAIQDVKNTGSSSGYIMRLFGDNRIHFDTAIKPFAKSLSIAKSIISAETETDATHHHRIT